MATFSSPDQLKDLKQYISLLKKSLVAVKPDTQKKFLYFKEYPFGPKKLPLVLVDFDAACPAALAKAGVKPTAEGTVSLTAENQLDFDAKKGTLKRLVLKKYFATLGPGLKPVFVPAGEIEEEEEGGAKGTAGTKQGADENASKRAEVLARIAGLEAKTFPPKTELLKKQVLDKARSLTEANHFAEVKVLLDQLEAKATAPGASPATTAAAPAKAGATDGDFRKEWSAAKQNWQTASQTVQAQLVQLGKAMRQFGDKDLEDIAAHDVSGVTGNFDGPLSTGIGEIDGADGPALKRASAKARIIIAGFRKHLDSDAAVKACDENPFKTPVSIRQTLSGALEKMDKALAGAAG